MGGDADRAQLFRNRETTSAKGSSSFTTRVAASWGPPSPDRIHVLVFWARVDVNMVGKVGEEETATANTIHKKPTWRCRSGERTRPRAQPRALFLIQHPQDHNDHCFADPPKRPMTVPPCPRPSHMGGTGFLVQREFVSHGLR